MTTTTALSLHAYWEAVGTECVRQVCEHAGTSFAYYKMMAYHFKGCSPEMMEKLEAAANLVTPGVKPDYAVCTRPSVIAAARQLRSARGAAKRAQRASGALRLRESSTPRAAA